MGDARDDDTAPEARGDGAASGRRARRGRATRTAAVALLVAVVLGLAVLAWVGAPSAYPPYTPPPGAAALSPEVAATERAASTQAIVTTRASVLAALAGLGALVTIGINYRNSRTQLRNAEIAARTLATTQETFRVTERGHQIGRYTAAIEQLGNTESIAIRLGGIYALEQLAQDSGRPGDQATVVEVLSAFIRIAPRATTTSPGPVGATTPPRPSLSWAEVEPAPDVTAALAVLGRLPHLEGVARADLTGADLTNASLASADLTGARFGRADLAGADLGEANLASAFLRRADLTGARLSGANLKGARLDSTDLTYALLDEADLTAARLDAANLTGARLDGANLTGARLDGANLTGARLNGANLADANLRGAVGVGLAAAQLAVVAVQPDGTPGRVTASDTDARTTTLDGESDSSQ